MTETSEHVEAVQELARTIYRISTVSVPELTITDEMLVTESSGDEWYELEQDEDWWEAWCEIYEIVEEMMGPTRIPDNEIRPDVESHLRKDTIRSTTEWTSLSVSVYADGHVTILAEYDNGGEDWMAVMFDSDAENVDPIKLGREVARAEISVIASQTQSCADTLDYWQTKMAPHPFKQHRWGEIRGVGRQTVHDRVQSALMALSQDEKSDSGNV